MSSAVLTKTIGVCVVEEQELFRELYRSSLGQKHDITLTDIFPWSNADGPDRIGNLISGSQPEVLLLSFKKLDQGIIEEIQNVRRTYPSLGIVLLLVNYSSKDIEMLRRVAVTGAGGMAIFLKQSLDMAQQICNIITSVSQGQIILDTKVTNVLLNDKPEYPFLKQLTGREVEVLGLLSDGFSNASIAKSLFIDLKTVEHHINSMYSKIKNSTDFNDRHPRVSAARLYLQATGDLTSEALDAPITPARRTVSG